MLSLILIGQRFQFCKSNTECLNLKYKLKWLHLHSCITKIQEIKNEIFYLFNVFIH